MLTAAACLAFAGCGMGKKKQSQPFFTSGNREADQRAEQRVSKTQQMKGTGEEGQGAESGKESKGAEASGKQTASKSLYDRLGGDQGIEAITADFFQRALADPRVNWTRKGETSGGFLGLDKKKVEWDPSPEASAKVKLHIRQFLAVASGGPAKYEGGPMKDVHHGMKVSNAEFDAAIGDLKASLDKLDIGTAEQKELIAIVESTRLQIVEQH